MRLAPTLKGASPRRDLMAALTLAAIAIPEQLATARLAGLPAAQGLVVFGAASLMMLLACRDCTLSVGADSTIAPLIAAALAGAGSASGTAALLAGLVGLTLLAVWALRLEWIAQLLSKPVAAGMLAGIAIHIIVGRLPTILGLDLPTGNVAATLTATLHHFGNAALAPALAASAVTALCLAGRALGRRFPSPLVALALVTAYATFADPDGTLLPRIPDVRAAASLSWPQPGVDRIVDLIPAALSIAFLCLSQTTVVLRDSGTEAPEVSRNAFGAIGLANLAAAAVGGFAVNSSPPRTEILRDSGASSQLAGFGAALAGLLLLWLGGAVLSLLPAAALAGVLVYIAIHLFPAKLLPDLLRRSRSEGAIAVATMLLVTFLPLQIGLPLAMLLSLVHASLPLFEPAVIELAPVAGTTVWWRGPTGDGRKGAGDPLVLALASPLNFANAVGIRDAICARLAARRNRPRVLVLECAGVIAVDLTGADMLSGLLTELRAQGIRVAVARLESARAESDLERSGFLDLLGRDHQFRSVDQAVRALGAA
ncbi:MAG: SulP family inorganic anion transporter [Rhodobacteraceae bacterium]|nr:SulP family inorganic anion transporter [Paracoccaceae bacterium]